MNQQLVGTFYISPLLRDLLGDTFERPISRDTAEVLLCQCKNKELCYIQLPENGDVDINGDIVKEPILWELAHWKLSTERWLRKKARSDAERDARYVFDANILIIKAAVMKQFGFSDTVAHTIARKMLDRKDFARIKAIGVTNLKQNINEL